MPLEDGVEVHKEPLPNVPVGQRLDMARSGNDPQLFRLFREAVELFPVPDGNDLVRISVDDEDGDGTDPPDPAAGAVPVGNEKGERGLEWPQEEHIGDLFPRDSPVSGKRAVDDQRPDPVPVRRIGDGVYGDGPAQGLPEDNDAVLVDPLHPEQPVDRRQGVHVDPLHIRRSPGPPVSPVVDEKDLIPLQGEPENGAYVGTDVFCVPVKEKDRSARLVVRPEEPSVEQHAVGRLEKYVFMNDAVEVRVRHEVPPRIEKVGIARRKDRQGGGEEKECEVPRETERHVATPA
jgi:hypothetical protein